MGVDYYGEADSISRNLAEFDTPWAERIEDAIAAASTGTEALMALRWTLREAIRDPSLSPDLRGSMESLAVSIDEALQD